MEFLQKPWNHQLAAIKECRNRKYYALFFEQGTGKTMTLINILRMLYIKRQRILRTLILCPKIVITNWEREFRMHSKIKSSIVRPLTGAAKLRVKMINEHGFHSKGNPAHKIFITNYEALNMPDVYDALWEWGPEVMILDESHRVKSMSSKRTKQAIKLADITDYRYLATGTPMPNSLMDIFPQYRILDKGESFGKNFYQFRAKYFEDKNRYMPSSHHFPNWQPRETMMTRLNKKILESSARVKKMECLDLPPLVKKRIDVDMCPPQAVAYNQMKKEFITYVEDKACVAQLAITKGLRLQQILSGFIKLEDGTIKRFDDAPRITGLRELLVDLTPGSKVIVWAVFKENYAMIRDVCEKEKIKYVEVHGEVGKKDEAVDAFNNDPDVRVFIGHPGSGGIGINLIESDVAIFFSRGFSLEMDLQAEARNHRGGSEKHKKITRIDMVAAGTLDEQIMEALARKEKMSESVLKDMVRNI